MKNQMRGKKGVTLIALVVTILVILILAGVTIATLTGDNGLLQKAQTAKDKKNISNIIEQIRLDIVEKQMDNFGRIDVDDFYQILEKYGSISYVDGTLITNEGNYSILLSDIYENGLVKECWKGKNAVFVGDSITYGIGTTEGSRYWEFLKEDLDLENVNSMGIAGSCISSKSDYGTLNTPLINRYNNIPSADLISIFMGTNDYGHETPLGNINDTTDISFYGALNVIIPALKQKYPTSRIVFITPLHRYGFGTSKIKGEAFTYDNLENGVGYNLGDYVNAIKEVCKKYSVDVIDLYKLSENELNPSIPALRESYFPDGLHPNEDGHKMIANILQNILCTMKPIENNNSIISFGDNSTSIKIGNGYATRYGECNK